MTIVPVLHHVPVVGDGESHLRVLLDEQDGCPLPVDRNDDLRHLLDQAGRETERRLVEDHQPGGLHQGPTDGQHLLLATGQVTGHLVPPAGQDREQVHDPLGGAPEPPRRSRTVYAPGRQVLGHRHLDEDAASLHHLADPHPHPGRRQDPG